MSVKVTLMGRLGNNLFQYALGRIIAEHHGLELECEHISQFTRTFTGGKQDISTTDTLEDPAIEFPYAPLYIPGEHIMTPIEYYHATPDNLSGHHIIDLPKVLADKTPRKIRLAAYFHRYEYYSPYSDRIREWFQLKPSKTPFVLHPNDVLVSIRRGVDYEIYDWTLPLPYYSHVLSNMSDLGQVYVCGTGIDDQVRRCLSKYDPIYYEGTPMEHFTFITLFNRIILSNSTFAWWAGFLSKATELYAPGAAHSKAFGFTGYREVDLHMREPRYREIDLTAII